MCLAVPGKITHITGEKNFDRLGKVDFGGITKEVNLAYVPEPRVGDYVVVHVGFAISRLDERAAKQTFEYLKQINELGEIKNNE